MNYFYKQIILNHSGLKAEAERLAAWEKALNDKEAALANCEKKLSQKEVAACAQKIFTDFRSTQQLMDGLRLSIVELKDTILRGDEQAVQDLCQLCQDMESNASEEVQAAGFTLAEILKKHFNTAPFSPGSGCSFDPLKHERVDCAKKGPQIEECYASGWKRGDTVLVKAVVDTTEKE